LSFTTGTPHRLELPEVYGAFVFELRRVIGLVHRAGVIHVDLYASNIMWKLEGDKVVIKIVDWDVSHCVDEKDFCPRIKALLADRVYAGQPVRFGEDHDNLYLSVFDMPLEERHFSYWAGLASGIKSTIDDAFQRLMQDWTTGFKDS
jgi:serine/threonine protein kinase